MKNKNQFNEYRDLIPFVDPAQKFSHSETVIRNKLILGTTFVLLASCVNLPKRDTPKPHVLPRMNCEKIEVRVGYYLEPFEYKNIEHHSLGDINHYTYADEDIFVKQLQRNINIKILPNNTNTKSLTLGFGTTYTTHNYGWLWVSILTYGLFPVMLDGETKLSLRVFDENGNIVSEYQSSTVSFDIYSGIWFWPYGWFSDRAKTARQLGPERLGSLIRELLDQAVKDRILPCL